MNLALWIVQGILAFAFIVVGLMKVLAYENCKSLTEKNEATGIILPMTTNIAPWLTTWAAVGLSAIMLVAIGFHLRRKESTVAPAVFFFLAMFVVYGRFTLLKQ
jgi:hypothetical protein